MVDVVAVVVVVELLKPGHSDWDTLEESVECPSSCQ